MSIRVPELQIIYKDSDLLVVNKPAGLLTSTNAREKRPTLLAQVKSYLAQTSPRCRPGLIHRLDKDASGLLIFSKNDPAYGSLKTQFFHHSVARVYHAIVVGTPHPPRGAIRSRLVETPTGKVHTTKHPTKGQPAVTHYEVVSSSPDLSLVKIALETGRKHQIRAQLCQIDHPILGDPLYGPRNKPFPRLMLIDSQLAIIHPRTGKPITWKLPLPREFEP
jgi:23S rRNA pseudouridine1911/1915/1917 synthase